MAVGGKGNIVINGVTYLRDEGAEGVITRQDLLPATSRAALGESQYDNFEGDAFISQANFAGGVGQERLLASDRVLTGVFDGRSGKAFPARKLQASGVTTANGRYFELDNTMTGRGWSYTGPTLYNLMSTGNIVKVDGAGSNTGTSGGTAPTNVAPVVTHHGSVLYAGTNGDVMRARYGVAAQENVTPPQITDVSLVAAHGRHVLGFGNRTKPSDIGVVGTPSRTNYEVTSSVVYRWAQQTLAGNTLVLVVAAAVENGSVPNITPPTGWVTAVSRSVNQSGVEPDLKAAIYYYPNAPAMRVTDPFIVDMGTAPVDGNISVVGIELEGTREPNGFTGTGAASGLASTAASSGTISTDGSTDDKIFIGVMLVDDTGMGLANEAGWTAAGGSYSSSFVGGEGMETVCGYLASTATSEEYNDTVTACGHVGVGIAFIESERTFDLDQMTVVLTEDDGETWDEVYTDIGTGVGKVLNAVAANQALWLWTTNGLYQMKLQEIRFENREEKFNLIMTGKEDQISTPKETTSFGSWPVIHEGILIYEYGASLRRQADPTTNLDQQLWPRPDWATVIGDVKAVVAGEGGVYFSSGGYLWNWNGYGVQCLAEEAVSGDFDTLSFFKGKLYCDAGKYFNFDFPSGRPDLYTTVSDFETGSVVFSAWDFGKVTLFKLLSVFEIHGKFTAATLSGSIELSYIAACQTATEDPGRIGGHAGSLTWTTIGSMDVDDGGFLKLNRDNWTPLDDEIKCRKIYFRIRLIPGTNGYPYLEAFSATGLVILPDIRQFRVPIAAKRGLLDREGDEYYGTQANVVTVIQALDALRGNEAAVDLEFDDASAADQSYRVITAQKADWLVEQIDTDGLEASILAIFRELPK